MIRNSKIRGSITYYLEVKDSDEILVTVYYKIAPGDPGTPYRDDGDPGNSSEPSEIEIEIYNEKEEIVEVDQITNDRIIDLCFEDSKGNEYDKYDDN